MGLLVLSSAETLQLVGSLVLLFLVAHLLGALARRIGQPGVVGYLLAGVVLGPSGLGAAWPQLVTFMLPPTGRSQLLGAVIELSLLMVLIVLGAETDVPLVRRLGRRSLGVIAAGIVVPLAAGSVAAYALGSRLVLSQRLAGAVLIGGGLAVSSLPVIARLVEELGISRRDVGQIALATAVANDVYGLLLLAVVEAGVSSTGTSALVRPLVGLVALVAVLAVIGQRGVDLFLQRVRHDGPNATGTVAVAVGAALAAAAALQAVGVDAALGAFAAGVLVGRSRFQHADSLARLRSFSDAVFAPLYFASAGLLINVGTLSSWHQVMVVAVLLVVAVASKAAGARLGARWAGLRRGENAALMTLLNGRGALQVIIATAGLRLGLLSSFAYTAILLVSIVSSALVSPVLRRLVGEWEGSEDEQRRLAHEERIEQSVFVREQRLLVPALDGTSPGLAAALFDAAWPEAAEITVLSPAPGADGPPVEGLGRLVRHRTAASADPVEAAIEESRLGYGVLGIGVPSTADGLPPGATALLNGSPLPIILACPSHGRSHDGAAPGQVAVATTGTIAGIAGEELATSLARRHQAGLHIVHVVPDDVAVRRRDRLVVGAAASEGMLTAAVGRARRLGLRPRSASARAASACRGLLDYARANDVDVLVVGARLRRVGDVPFLGYTVEELLRAPSRPALAVVVFPDAPPGDPDQPYLERAAT